jgi:hypothetical protein
MSLGPTPLIVTSSIVADDGRTLVRKQGSAPSDAVSLAREAAMLDLARHPGVVVLERASSEGHGDLSTVHAGSRTLAGDGLTLDEQLKAIAAAAETLADLHALGIVHGRVDETHVVLGDRARPVLCGFRAAGLAGDHDPDGARLRPANDVAALGALLHRALASATDDGREAPVGRRAGRLGELRRLAATAMSQEATRRPTARRFAAALDELAGTRSEPAPHPGETDGRSRLQAAIRVRPSGRVLAGAALALGVSLLALGSATLRGGGAPTAGSTHGPAPADQADPVDQALPDGATPGDAIGPVPGGVVDIDTHQYLIGEPTDTVFVAEWGCADHPTAVIIRPSGAVFRFDGWATPQHDLAAVPVGTVEHPTIVRAERDANGCLVLATPGTDPDRTLDPEAAP